ncbi:MAG: hypothetical protein KDK05_20415 [Candidatus Competibacteraceae bacterium]|nr:hypothetical protein [Candidatus Competibacteraceae bacterium]
MAIETAVSSNMNRLDDLAWKHNEARRLTLDGGYDALLHIDADMVVPADTVKRLCAVGADVVYGLYVSRQTPSRWLCFVNKAMTTTLDQVPPSNTDYVRSFGAGLGCTLIHRRVLEQIEFRHNGQTGSDWWFAIDAANYGFRQMHDLGCVCGHIDRNRVLWPDASTEEMYRVEQVRIDY